jgi:hypothetical protein
MGKYDWGEVAGDTVSGATTGFSFGGPVGAGIGGLAGFAKGLFTRKKKKKKKISTLDKNQQDPLAIYMIMIQRRLMMFLIRTLQVKRIEIGKKRLCLRSQETSEAKA